MAGWGSDRLVNSWLGEFWGDQVPVVRCFHHKTEESYENRVLNLTRSGRIYRATGIWDAHPDSLAAYLDRAHGDLADPVQFRKKWYLGPFEMYLSDKVADDDYKQLRPRFAPLADQLAALGAAGDANTRRIATRNAARLYIGAGEYAKAVAAMKQSIRSASEAGDYGPTRFESQIEPDVMVLADAYNGLGDHEQALLLNLLLHSYRKDVGTFMERTAQTQEQMGHSRQAGGWHDAADPARLLVGKPAPGFQLHTVGGKRLSLKDALAAHKAVLVNFWFYQCGPCRAEAPELQKLYREFKPQGLEIISIDSGDSKEDAEKFIAELGLEFEVVPGAGQSGDTKDVVGAFHVKGYPSNYLLDHGGKVVWRNTGYGDEGKAAMREQVKKLVAE